MTTGTYVPFASPTAVRHNIRSEGKKRLAAKIAARSFEFTTLDLLGPEAVDQLKRLPEMPDSLVRIGPKQYLNLAVQGLLILEEYRRKVYRIVSETTFRPLTKNRMHLLTADPNRHVPKGYRLIPTGVRKSDYQKFMGKAVAVTTVPKPSASAALEPVIATPEAMRNAAVMLEVMSQREEPQMVAHTNKRSVDWQSLALRFAGINGDLLGIISDLQDALMVDDK